MQKDRKKEHKKIVKHMQLINKQLAADEYMGLNRFRIDMFMEDWHRYADGSLCLETDSYIRYRFIATSLDILIWQ